MNVFQVDADLVGRYEACARSFTTIHHDDISAQVDVIYSRGKFCQEALIGDNQQFEQRTRCPVLAAQAELTAKGLRPHPERYW